MTLPVALSGSDVIGQAKTGTGKTLGFGLPLLERVTVPADVEAGRAKPEDLTDAPQALVVVPTRELCTQVTNDLLTAGKVRNVRVLAIYGGRAYEPQVEALKKGVDVVVGTPGRLLDLAGQKKLNLKHVRCLVLDEADEMLDLGFLPDVEKIINMLPVRRQTMLFSATMPGAVIGLARRYMSQPTHISATAPDDAGATVANTKQFVYRAHNMDKPEMVARILQAEGRGLAMVFCRTKRTAADLADQLKQRGFASGAVHGDLGQGAREQALRAFRNGKVDVLVCTDVAARGIDVEGVTHVINYQSPEEEKTYLHRIGRTGRAGAKGTAITLVDWDDIPRWQLINKALDLGFSDPPETYSTSPHLFSDLGIPEGTKGILPRSERTRAGLDAEELEDLGETGGRGPRGRGGRGGRGDDRDESRSADRERSARTPRRRRRTRGGTPLDAPGSAGVTAPETGATAPVAGGAAEAEAVTAPRTPRRRRRTRGGAPAEAAPVTAVETSSSAPAEDAVATAEGTTEAPETAAKPRRRRTRRSETAVVETPATQTPAVETEAAVTPSATEPAVVTEAAPVTPEPEATTPRRRTRKATSPAAEAAVDTAEATETEPRRTRKTAAAAETAVDTAEATEAKPRRTRKAAAVEADGEAAEAKPRRTRKTAAAKAETAVDTAEATEAKPRRTRKTAAVETDAEVAETKPRRTRKATATKAEAAADTAEATEAKPRRRTRKAAEPTEPAQAADIPAQAAQEPDATEAKPRRTRKTAAAEAEAADGVAEAKPRVRRTRKATAAAESTEG
ncbi:DEAD/DEAH box helicase [Streptomyces dubilierae]|uniref:RNA helicase n=1 Tax=Streptomyces dubilierae TaxID=3075533 RepID=A0ABU2P8C2_9ACTN|nr:DEAD/DEAH box helicase [Streptomyces sp. DSM 41921]MDT0387030.1 DEAD/DEAH box helicase [Streptomyces sp. DSM 41921]